MNKTLLCMLALIGLLSCQANSADKKPAKVDLKTKIDSVSYSIGMQIGAGMLAQKIEIAEAAFMRGLLDAMKDVDEKMLSQEEAQQVMMEFQQELMAKQQEKDNALMKTNVEEGEKFLAENAQKEGVITTESGLQYKVLKKGSGKTPGPQNQVTTHYTGRLIDGTVFDSSVERGQPMQFSVGGVIPGWTEALQLMKEGDEWELYIPSKLAYGERRAGPEIGPNSTLIFKLELISVDD